MLINHRTRFAIFAASEDSEPRNRHVDCNFDRVQSNIPITLCCGLVLCYALYFSFYSLTAYNRYGLTVA